MQAGAQRSDWLSALYLVRLREITAPRWGDDLLVAPVIGRICAPLLRKAHCRKRPPRQHRLPFYGRG